MDSEPPRLDPPLMDNNDAPTKHTYDRDGFTRLPLKYQLGAIIALVVILVAIVLVIVLVVIPGSESFRHQRYHRTKNPYFQY
jgi:hypothetical protein